MTAGRFRLETDRGQEIEKENKNTRMEKMFLGILPATTNKRSAAREILRLKGIISIFKYTNPLSSMQPSNGYSLKENTL